MMSKLVGRAEDARSAETGSPRSTRAMAASASIPPASQAAPCRAVAMPAIRQRQIVIRGKPGALLPEQPREPPPDVAEPDQGEVRTH